LKNFTRFCRASAVENTRKFGPRERREKEAEGQLLIQCRFFNLSNFVYLFSCVAKTAVRKLNDARRGDDFMEIELNEAREQQFEYLEEDEDFLSADSEENSGSFEDNGPSNS
jgi:hypothetical protein